MCIRQTEAKKKKIGRQVIRVHTLWGRKDFYLNDFCNEVSLNELLMCWEGIIIRVTSNVGNERAFHCRSFESVNILIIIYFKLQTKMHRMHSCKQWAQLLHPWLKPNPFKVDWAEPNDINVLDFRSPKWKCEMFHRRYLEPESREIVFRLNHFWSRHQNYIPK